MFKNDKKSEIKFSSNIPRGKQDEIANKLGCRRVDSFGKYLDGYVDISSQGR